MYAKGLLRYPKQSKGRGPELHGLTGDDRLAVQWALSEGYSVPSKPSGCLWAIGIVCGLFAAVVPGLFLLLTLVLKQRDFEREIRHLRNRWVDAGKPLPSPNQTSEYSEEDADAQRRRILGMK